MNVKISENCNAREFTVFENIHDTASQIRYHRLNGESFDTMAPVFQVSQVTLISFVHQYIDLVYPENDFNKTAKRYLEFSRKSIKEIADGLGIPVKGLRNFMSDTGISRNITVSKINALIERGHNAKQMCAYFDVSPYTLRQFMKKNGMHLPKGDEKLTIGRLAGIVVLQDREYFSAQPADIINPQYNEQIGQKLESDIRFIQKIEEFQRTLTEVPYSNTRHIERFQMKYDFYRGSAQGFASVNNFFYNTICIFKECSRPNRPPDIIVNHGNSKREEARYWINPKKGVIRATKMWHTDQGFNLWAIAQKNGQMIIPEEFNYSASPHMQYGFAAWKDFFYMTELYSDFGHKIIANFQNTIFGDIHQRRARNIIGPITDKNGFNIENYLF